MIELIICFFCGTVTGYLLLKTGMYTIIKNTQASRGDRKRIRCESKKFSCMLCLNYLNDKKNKGWIQRGNNEPDLNIKAPDLGRYS